MGLRVPERPPRGRARWGKESDGDQEEQCRKAGPDGEPEDDGDQEDGGRAEGRAGGGAEPAESDREARVAEDIGARRIGARRPGARFAGDVVARAPLVARIEARPLSPRYRSRSRSRATRASRTRTGDDPPG
jgi:hypothetical protein